jgi:hypothetical protein
LAVPESHSRFCKAGRRTPPARLRQMHTCERVLLGLSTVPLDPDPDRRTFWKTRRRRYNLALLASGLLAGVMFFAVLVAWEVWPPSPGEFAHADFEPLSLIGGPIAFAVGVGFANVCYSLGAKMEVLLRPRDPEAFRERAFALGLAFSVALPWVVPLNAWSEFITVKLRG